MTKPLRPRARRRALALATAAAGLLALSGCSFVAGDDGASASQADPPAGSAAPTSDDAAEIATDAPLGVGPFMVPAPSYWVAGDTASDGVAHVAAGGCQKGAPCPGFDVLVGDLATTAADAQDGWLPDGATCPGAEKARARLSGEEPQTVAATIAGLPGTRSVVQLECVKDGTVVSTAAQTQWTVRDSPVGTVVVVDRWAFEGLDARLAAATWMPEGHEGHQGH